MKSYVQKVKEQNLFILGKTQRRIWQIPENQLRKLKVHLEVKKKEGQT